MSHLETMEEVAKKLVDWYVVSEYSNFITYIKEDDDWYKVEVKKLTKGAVQSLMHMGYITDDCEGGRR